MFPCTRTSRFFFSLGLGLAVAASPAIWAAEQSGVLAQQVAVRQVSGRQVSEQQLLAQADVPAQVRQGYTRLGSGQVEAAIEIFQQAIRQFPRSIEAKLGLAIAYRRAGRDQASWDAYQAVLQQEPDNKLALKTVGLLGGFRSEWQVSGIDALTKFLALEPKDEEARAQRALLYGYQGRFAEAIADYEAVLQGGAAAPEILLGAAQIYTYSGDFARGLDLFNRYRAKGGAIDQNAAIAYARALRGTGNATAAAQILEAQLNSSANRSEETAIQLRSELAQSYLDAGRPADALALLEPLRGRREARLPLARALNEIGQSQNIAELLTEAAALYRAELQETTAPSSSLLSEAADVLSGIPAERAFARQLYGQIAQAEPNNRIVQLKLVVLDAQLGRLGQAEARQRVLMLAQPLPPQPAEQRALAQALVPLDPFPELLLIYQQLLAANVEVPFLNFRVAQLLIERNDFAAAQAALAAYQLTPGGAQDLAPQLLYADIERRQNRFEASATRYIAILNTGTSDEDIRLAAIRGLAGIRLSQGRPQDALALYDQLLAKQPGDLQLQLARTSIAYEQNLITDADAEAVLNLWLATRPGETVPELYTLAAALPTTARRERLYQTLAIGDPASIPIQARWVEAVALRNRYEGRALLDRLVNDARAASPNTPFSYLLEAQLAQALDQLDRSGQAYEVVLKREPYNESALAGLAGLRFQQRRHNEAEALYTQLLAYQPGDRLATQSLAELLLVRGRKLDALDQLQELDRAAGTRSTTTALRMRQIQEDFLRQRGFQPAWERF